MHSSASSAVALATKEFLRDVMSSGAPLELSVGKEQWQARHFRFNPDSGALESYRKNASAGAVQTFITLRRFQVAASSSDLVRFHIKTPNKIFILRATSASVKNLWLQWLERMQGEQAVIDQRARLPATAGNTEKAQDYWIPDDEADYCAGCGKAFALTRRRHHCRDCGFTLCAASTCLVAGSKTCQLCVREKSLGGRVAAAQALAARAMPVPVPATPVQAGGASFSQHYNAAGQLVYGAQQHPQQPQQNPDGSVMMQLADVPYPASNGGGDDGARRRSSRAGSSVGGKKSRRNAAASSDPTGSAAVGAESSSAAVAAAVEDAAGAKQVASGSKDKWVFIIAAIGMLFWLYSALVTPGQNKHISS